jgi:hypothetical protein
MATLVCAISNTLAFNSGDHSASGKPRKKTAELGGSVARWTTTGETLLLGHVPKGIGLRFSTDGINFTAMREPLMVDSQLRSFCLVMHFTDGLNHGLRLVKLDVFRTIAGEDLSSVGR